MCFVDISLNLPFSESSKRTFLPPTLCASSEINTARLKELSRKVLRPLSFLERPVKRPPGIPKVSISPIALKILAYSSGISFENK